MSQEESKLKETKETVITKANEAATKAKETKDVVVDKTKEAIPPIVNTAKNNAGLISVVASVLLSIILYARLQPALTYSALYPELENIGTKDCVTYDLAGCDKIALHEPSGHLYTVCYDPSTRAAWAPVLGRFNKSGAASAANNGRVVVIDPTVSPPAYKDIKLWNIRPNFHINPSGMDIVPSTLPGEKDYFYAYFINHRHHLLEGINEEDPAVEIFKGRQGKTDLVFQKSAAHPGYMVAPNDVVGTSDGKGFWVTNDHNSKAGFFRKFSEYFRTNGLGVLYCHWDSDPRCRIVTNNLPPANGIAHTKVGAVETFYVAGHRFNGKIYVLERQADDSLVLVDEINIGREIDNLTIDKDGSIYAAIVSRPLSYAAHASDPYNKLFPSTVLKISRNRDQSAFFGKKYNIEKIFEDPTGEVASGVSTALYDTKNGRLWLTGYASKSITSCKL